MDESDEFRTLSSTTIDFNIPEGGEKPSVDMWGYVVFDESNDIAFMEAEQAYNSSFHTETHEWVNNFGLRNQASNGLGQILLVLIQIRIGEFRWTMPG